MLLPERCCCHDRYLTYGFVWKLTNLIEQPVAVPVRHGDITQDDIRSDFVGQSQGDDRRRRGRDGGATGSERDREEINRVLVVIHDEYLQPLEIPRHPRWLRRRRLTMMAPRARIVPVTAFGPRMHPPA